MVYVAAICAATSAHADLSAEDLAKIAQNPVGNLISVPFQEDAYFNVGPQDGTQNVLNIQPEVKGQTAVLFFQREDVTPDIAEKSAEIRRLLQLSADGNKFTLIYSPSRGGPGELAVNCRSPAAARSCR